ncbi:MarR family winged helix-turn-helix transcriptional regulator [Streptomyces sp. S1A]|uniref:MarR family winged helix-turn-helix transcriptional regulator n=1 Tax=Streptomyces sp. ICN903 TaxID=2964654 RepID=UPI001EDC4675|nr:MarR family winged helix-turn-helix transcriptional regulator [Streptomyces sp. ICN903]MCG3041837.1 MarR family winged helix-turn-helix transcriptional regulator [Streptomyces sp. ICN903]
MKEEQDGAAQGEELLSQARELTPALYALARVLRLRGVREAGLAQLPPSELEVLRYVLDAPGTSLGELARALGLRTSNASTTVRGLVAQDLLRREPDPRDRRLVRLHPTMNAVHGMARVEGAWAEVFAQALGELADGERESLTAALPALRALGRALMTHRQEAARST